MLTDFEKKLAGILPWESSGPQEHGENNWYDLSMNYNSWPYDTDTAIIVTSHRGHLKYLKATLTNYRLTGKFVICAYDIPIYPWSNLSDPWSYPPPDIKILANSWVEKHQTYDCDKRNGWFWDLRYAEGIVNQFDNIKYVFSVNGDCIWERPEGVGDVISLLGDADLMASSSDAHKDGGTIHTCSVIYKREAFHKVMTDMISKMRVPVIGSRSPEVMLREAVYRLGLKEKKAPKQPLDPHGNIDHYNGYGGDCTWKELLGFRNLDAEIQFAATERREPPPKEYIDIRGDGVWLNSHERVTIKNYYETGDRRWLYAFWDQGADSDYDRKFYPLEHYGKEPILEETWDSSEPT